MTQQERLVNRALEYARRGWFVFPIDPRDKAPIPARDKDANGQPIDGTGGFYKSTRDNDQIVAWWDEHPAAMIGVRTGMAAGSIILPMAERVSRLTEGVEIIRRLWTESRVTHHGRHWQLDDLSIHPRPLQQIHEVIDTLA